MLIYSRDKGLLKFSWHQVYQLLNPPCPFLLNITGARAVLMKLLAKVCES